ncbi:hypothetical protein AU381_15150 [Sinorhizobium glycinis]|uniref:Uncharacterized protein n=1 Tax=Sinorhizobium glycinis TaxID=1472378 RepID=A0A178Y5S6_9HYPH|nr:hypothetical protein AU381_15150 [Sinorhizobium glycinis]
MVAIHPRRTSANQGKLLAAAALGWRNGRQRLALARTHLHLQRTVIRVTADPVGNALGVIKGRTVVEMGDPLLIEEMFITPVKVEEIVPHVVAPGLRVAVE